MTPQPAAKQPWKLSLALSLCLIFAAALAFSSIIFSSRTANADDDRQQRVVRSDDHHQREAGHRGDRDNAERRDRDERRETAAHDDDDEDEDCDDEDDGDDDDDGDDEDGDDEKDEDCDEDEDEGDDDDAQVLRVLTALRRELAELRAEVHALHGGHARQSNVRDGDRDRPHPERGAEPQRDSQRVRVRNQPTRNPQPRDRD